MFKSVSLTLGKNTFNQNQEKIEKLHLEDSTHVTTHQVKMKHRYVRQRKLVKTIQYQ